MSGYRCVVVKFEGDEDLRGAVTVQVRGDSRVTAERIAAACRAAGLVVVLEHDVLAPGRGVVGIVWEGERSVPAPAAGRAVKLEEASVDGAVMICPLGCGVEKLPTSADLSNGTVHAVEDCDVRCEACGSTPASARRPWSAFIPAAVH